MIDADHFKQVNDTYGHAAGDQCLKQLADLMRRHFDQPQDHLIRFGGEEFIVLTTGADYQWICDRLEQLRLSVAQQAVQVGGTTFYFTVSLGALIHQPTPGDNLDLWLKKADSALYKAKSSGRNRLIIHQDSDPSLRTEYSPSDRYASSEKHHEQNR